MGGYTSIFLDELICPNCKNNKFLLRLDVLSDYIVVLCPDCGFKVSGNDFLDILLDFDFGERVLK